MTERTKQGMHNLHGSHRLRPLGPLADTGVYRLRPALAEQRDGAAEDDGPGDGGREVVENEVRLVEHRRLALRRDGGGGGHGCEDPVFAGR